MWIQVKLWIFRIIDIFSGIEIVFFPMYKIVYSHFLFYFPNLVFDTLHHCDRSIFLVIWLAYLPNWFRLFCLYFNLPIHTPYVLRLFSNKLENGPAISICLLPIRRLLYYCKIGVYHQPAVRVFSIYSNFYIFAISQI